jgi:hypothetical protein
MNGFTLYSFPEDDDGSLDVTQALLYIAALACCVAPSPDEMFCLVLGFVAYTYFICIPDQEANLGLRRR